MSHFTILGSRDALVVGDNCRITREPWPFFDVKGGGIVIGDGVTISSGVYIHTHSHHFDKANWRDLDEIRPEEPTEICDGVFLGVGCQIMPSCRRVGKHSVVGAGAIVVKDIPDLEIWAGNPARKIGAVSAFREG